MRHLPHSERTGLSRLGRYTVGRRKRLTGVMLIAAVSAAAPVAGWAIVGDAIDNGIKADNLTRLTADVVLYSAIGLTAWILGTTTWLMLAGIGQQIVLDLRRDLFQHLTSLSLRYFSQQKAGWIIARLTSDVDALSDVLNQGLTTLVVNSMTLVAAIVGLFVLDWRLGVVALIILPPGIVVTRWFQTTSHVAFADVRTRIAAVTAQLAESGEDDRLGVARDRHADRGHGHAPVDLPAVAGALRAVRAGSGGERCDDEDLDRSRRRAGHHRP